MAKYLTDSGLYTYDAAIKDYIHSHASGLSHLSYVVNASADTDMTYTNILNIMSKWRGYVGDKVDRDSYFSYALAMTLNVTPLSDTGTMSRYNICLYGNSYAGYTPQPQFIKVFDGLSLMFAGRDANAIGENYQTYKMMQCYACGYKALAIDLVVDFLHVAKPNPSNLEAAWQPVDTDMYGDYVWFGAESDRVDYSSTTLPSDIVAIP